MASDKSQPTGAATAMPPAASPLARPIAAATPDAQPYSLGVRARALLGVLCVCAAVAPLAARWILGDTARIVYGSLVVALLLAFALLAGQTSSLDRYRDLSLALLVFAVVQVLNNSLPRFVGIAILHQPPVAGNPLASTVWGSVVIQLVDTAIAVVPIVVFALAFGKGLGSVYARWGRRGKAFAFALLAFLLLYVLTARIAHRMFPTAEAITLSRYLALTPALLVAVLSNGFQEELLFRGLFLKQYDTFFGPRAANVLQAAVFALAHVGVTYTPFTLLFLVAFVFPLGLFDGYLMRRTNGVLTPAIFHAATDIPIYLAFLSYVS